jgi:hypothetical protein
MTAVSFCHASAEEVVASAATRIAAPTDKLKCQMALISMHKCYGEMGIEAGYRVDW